MSSSLVKLFKASKNLRQYSALCILLWIACQAADVVAAPRLQSSPLYMLSASTRFNELDSQDGYSSALSAAKRFGDYQLGLLFETHTLIDGVWFGLGARYQPRGKRVGFGLSAAVRVGGSEEDNVGGEADYVTPVIAYLSYQLFPATLDNGIFIELRPGFDLQYLDPPADSLVGPAAGFVIGSSLAIGIRF